MNEGNMKAGTKFHKLAEDIGRYRELVESMPGGYYRSTEDGTLVDANDAFARMLGYSLDELYTIGNTREFYFDAAERTRNDRRPQFPMQPVEYRLRHKNGTAVWVEDYPRDLYDQHSNLVYREGICQDITARHDAEERLKSSLDEKNILLREIHHRVKNNLQVVSSLLSLQSSRASGNEVRRVLDDSQRRIRAIAMVHQKLYRSDSFANISFDEYVREFAEEIRRFYDKGNIRILYDTEPVHLDLDIASPCGLIFNELLTNALKHGFPDDRRGCITIGVKLSDSTFLLSVGHDGVGVPEGFDLHSPQSMGMTLVVSLVKQLKGSLSLESVNPTRFVVQFDI